MPPVKIEKKARALATSNLSTMCSRIPKKAAAQSKDSESVHSGNSSDSHSISSAAGLRRREVFDLCRDETDEDRTHRRIIAKSKAIVARLASSAAATDATSKSYTNWPYPVTQNKKNHSGTHSYDKKITFLEGQLHEVRRTLHEQVDQLCATNSSYVDDRLKDMQASIKRVRQLFDEIGSFQPKTRDYEY